MKGMSASQHSEMGLNVKVFVMEDDLTSKLAFAFMRLFEE